jgi:branched-chain amino acid transport system permease protein
MANVEYIVTGLVIGAIYAMVALGFTFLYSTAKVLNFSHGQMYMIGAFVSYLVVDNLASIGRVGGFGVVAPIVGLLAAGLAGGVAGLLANAVVFRPLRKADSLMQAMSSFGLTIAITDIALLWAGPNYLQAPSLWPPTGFHLIGAKITYVALILIALALVCMIVFDWLLNRTAFGKTTKAVAENPTVAALMGINTERVLSVSFFTASLLGGVSGFLITYYYGAIYFNMGFDAAVSGFTAAILGGFGSVRGAIAGGLLLGILTSFAEGYIGGVWNNAVPLIILILVVVIRPTGLVGSRVTVVE